MNTQEQPPTLAESLAEAKGLTPRAIAEAVDLSESQVRNILSGRTESPNVRVAVRIARLLGLPVERIWPPDAKPKQDRESA
jgi:transcriptional regulator with XRE-family HTH domain